MAKLQSAVREDKNEKHTLISQLSHVSHSRETHKHGETRFTSLTRGRETADVRPGRRRHGNCKAGGGVATRRRELCYCQLKQAHQRVGKSRHSFVALQRVRGPSFDVFCTLLFGAVTQMKKSLSYVAVTEGNKLSIRYPNTLLILMCHYYIRETYFERIGTYHKITYIKFSL